MSKRLTQLTSKDIRLVNDAFYRPRRNAREFQQPEIDKMVRENFIELAQLVWTSSIVHSLRKDGTQRFS